MKETSLVIMAAGIGSRFGKGIKQLEKVGPCGEIIMDYSIHDALQAGFNKIVFIIRRDIEQEFHEIIGKRIANYAEITYVFQDLTDLPEGFSPVNGRTKPWGTGQAVLAARNVIHEPFAVVNADDYYGKTAFSLLHQYLTAEKNRTPGVQDICMAAFRLGNTLSDNGGVTRGICTMDERRRLLGIRETKNIVRTKDGAGILENGGITPVDPMTPVSMNMWGFHPEFIESLKKGFVEFLSSEETDLQSGEYLLPIYIDGLLKKEEAAVTVLDSPDSWFGVTYQEDKDTVKEAFAELTRKGVYEKELYTDLKRI